MPEKFKQYWESDPVLLVWTQEWVSFDRVQIGPYNKGCSALAENQIWPRLQAASWEFFKILH